MSEALVGVVGAYGAVGRAAVARLAARAGPCRLRLAGKSEEPLRAVAHAAGLSEADIYVVDVYDHAALAHFCAGCSVIINCAGPSHRLCDRVAQAALEQGADYVDPSGDELLLARLERLTARAPGRVAIASAGMLPGLSGILPRWMALGFERCEQLTGYIGALDRFTPAGLQDYLMGLAAGESLRSWENGKSAPASATRLIDIDLPFFSQRVSAHPYLNCEGERLARALDLTRAHFYNVFGGEHLLSALARVMGTPPELRTSGGAARDVERAVDLELAGRTPYVLYLFQLDGICEGQVRTRSLMMRARGASELTGAVAAATAQALIEAEIPVGAHFAADVLAPCLTIQRLREAPVVSAWEVWSGSLQAAVAVEEGVL